MALINIDVHVHFPAGHLGNELTNVLKAMERRLLMAIGVETQKVLDTLNTATSALGDRIAAIVAKETDISPEGAAALNAVAANLNAMAQDPVQPVPPIEPLAERFRRR